MKRRCGFVSNSSSASFVIQKKVLNSLQFKAIMNHDEYAFKVLKWHPFGNDKDFTGDKWENIKETPFTIEGYTVMDNFDMEKFFRAIGLKPKDYCFESDS